MYNSISGKYSGRSKSSLFLVNGGVEWSISSSENTIRQAMSTEGELRICTYLYHKEDSMALYGFYTERERLVFLELIRVSGIGPKQALRMLSGISTEDLVSALDNGDTDRLSLLPGIGKKTAAKIVLALRGKLKLESDNKEEARFSDLIEALADMGFDRKSAMKALAIISAKDEYSSITDEAAEKELFREAIVYLSSH